MIKQKGNYDSDGNYQNNLTQKREEKESKSKIEIDRMKHRRRPQ